MQSLKVPTLGFVFALILAGYTIWDLDQISSRARGSLARAGIELPAAALAGVPAAAGGTGLPAAAFSGTAGISPDQGSRAAGNYPAEPDQGDAVPAARSSARGVLLSPGMTVACRIAMGTTMAFMLFIMI
jgi:hypothetical protein